jgi:hypothetical protein
MTAERKEEHFTFRSYIIDCITVERALRSRAIDFLNIQKEKDQEQKDQEMHLVICC